VSSRADAIFAGIYFGLRRSNSHQFSVRTMHDATCRLYISPRNNCDTLLREVMYRVPGVLSLPVRRRRLGQELRQLHGAAGLTIEEIAQRLEVSPAKISRNETGRLNVRRRDVSDSLDRSSMLDEAVLGHHIGPPEVMHSQYRRLLEFSEQNNIMIQVLPFDTGVYSGVPGDNATTPSRSRDRCNRVS
jgi:hypothetical protein